MFLLVASLLSMPPAGETADAPPSGRALVIAGGLTSGVTYGAGSLLGTVLSAELGGGWLWFNLPIAGPALWGGDICAHDGVRGVRPCIGQVVGGAVIGLVQVAGLVMLVAGATRPSRSPPVLSLALSPGGGGLEARF